MAQKVIVTMADDLDGTEETETDKVETVHFALEKHVFKIDLRKANRVKLEEALAPFIEHAQPADPEYRRTVAPVTGSVQRTQPRRTPESRKRSAEIRDWAREQGLFVSERGRIGRGIEEKYHDAHRTSL